MTRRRRRRSRAARAKIWRTPRERGGRGRLSGGSGATNSSDARADALLVRQGASAGSDVCGLASVHLRRPSIKSVNKARLVSALPGCFTRKTDARIDDSSLKQVVKQLQPQRQQLQQQLTQRQLLHVQQQVAQLQKSLMAATILPSLPLPEAATSCCAASLASVPPPAHGGHDAAIGRELLRWGRGNVMFIQV